jgi:hypothetical protein
VAPFRTDLVVAVECMFTWDWLADRCAAEGIAFVLGHALAMNAIHGGKATNDKIDSHTIAVLLRGGMLPQAYVYPAAMRSTRDLLRPAAAPGPQARPAPGAHSEHARAVQPAGLREAPRVSRGTARGSSTTFPIRSCARASRSTSRSSGSAAE